MRGSGAARAELKWASTNGKCLERRIDERAPTRHMRKTARTGTVLRRSTVGDTDVGPS